MAQYARPDSDVSASNWTGSYTAIDEVSPSEADYIVGANTDNGTFECGLSNVDTPETTTCTIRFRACKSAAAGHDRQVSVQVFQGSTAKGAAVASGNLSETWTLYSSAAIDLSGVTDWTDLRFRIVSSGDTGTPAPSRRYVWVSWAELETPDAVSSIELEIADSGHSHSAEAPALTQHNVLAVSDSSHAHAVDNVVLTQHNILAVADSSHAHAVDAPVLTAHEPTVELVIADSAHAHAVDGLDLVQHNVLVIADSSHAHAADGLALTQHNVLVIADTWHAHLADGPILSTDTYAILVIDDSTHSHSADALDLVQHYVLAIADSSHGHSVDGLELTQHNVLVIADTWHAHTVDGLNFDGDLLRSLVNTVVFQWFAMHIQSRRHRR